MAANRMQQKYDDKSMRNLAFLHGLINDLQYYEK
jgi:hypothetical protein